MATILKNLRQVAASIGITGNFNVVRDFFGYVTGTPVSLLFPGSASISLRNQLLFLQVAGYIDVNLIRVGIESFTDANEKKIDQAVHFVRQTSILAFVIGRVERFSITTAEANGRDNIGSQDEAEELTNEWSVPNDALDVFFVLTYLGTNIGLTPIDGPCNKNAKGIDGCVVPIDGTANITGFTLAHEIGHYLGLSHTSSDSNLMFPTVPNGGQLTDDQRSKMEGHCLERTIPRPP